MPQTGSSAASPKSKKKPEPELRDRLKEVLKHTTEDDVAARISRKISKNNIRAFVAGNYELSNGEKLILEEVVREIESENEA